MTTTKRKTFLFYTKIAFLLLIFQSCRSAKYIDNDQALVTKVNMTGVPTELKEQAVSYIANEIRPNSALNLTIYNIFNTKRGQYKKNNIRNVGEAPQLLDSSLVELSATQIQQFLHSKGYFKANVQPVINTLGKKAKIDFLTTLNEPYTINEIDYTFADTAMKNIYFNQVFPNTSIKHGEQYNTSNLIDEREKLYQAAKNKGYYDFLRQYTRVGVDTNGFVNKANLSISVSNPEDSSHQIYRINNVNLNIYPADQNSRVANSTIDTTGQFNFKDRTSKFRMKPIQRYVFIRPNQKYNLQNEIMSYDRLYEMNGFKSVKINYTTIDTNMLDVSIDLISNPRMSNQVEGEYTFSSGMSGFNVGNTFSHRNVFGGAEVAEVKLRYGVLFDPRLPGSLSQKIFNNDFQIGVNLIVPRLMTPFNLNSTARYGLPKTTFSSSLQVFDQDRTYSNRYILNTLNYSWWQSPNLMHSYTPLVIEYRQGEFDKTFRESLIEEGYILYVESNNRAYFGLGSQYTITWNASQLQKLGSFSFLRAHLDASGNTLGVLSHLLKFKKNADNQNIILDVPFLQYIKGELDYRRYKHFGGNKQFIFRFNAGLAVPYGNNSELLIFEKSFFAGGMNDIRAWQLRTLGPGNYNRSSIQSEQLRLNLRNLDQLGEVKIVSNLEYRFRLVNEFLGAKLNGATFLDIGNVWRLRENTLNENGTFQFNKLFSQLAVGTGFGLRFDMEYFVFRLDAGLKIKDPQFIKQDQWVVKHLFNSRTFKDDFYQTHKPDRYNFIQYNFGIGLPF